MGLFNKLDANVIKAAAVRSQQVLPNKKQVNARSIKESINAISDKVVQHFKDSKAVLITSAEQLHAYIDHMIVCGIGAIDTETTGLNRIKDTIVGWSLYFPDDVEVYIPCKHIVPIFDTPYDNQLTYDQCGAELQRLVDAKVKLIFANADFDLAMIYKDFKVDLLPITFYDVILAWRCIKENEQDNSLKGLYTKYVMKGQIDRMKFSDFFTPDLFPYCDPNIA
jgi:DNA polymerase I-like protein with 3'-5' exonuclease and polymerase domains